MTSPDSAAVDRAALLGAALAAVVALTFGGQGEWTWLAATAGLALLGVLGAFFRLPPSTIRRRTARAELAAGAAVAALASGLVLSVPLQTVLDADTPAGLRCRAAGEVAAAELLATAGPAGEAASGRLAATGRPASPATALALAADERAHEAWGICIGAVTSDVLWLPVAFVAVVLVGLGELHLRRVTRAP